MKTLRILGFAGSLRKKSYNRMLLEAAIDLAPDSMEIFRFDLLDLPIYNGDVEDLGDPEKVLALKSAIADADGVLIVSPEYNASVPAVTKNAVDWASRPYRGGKQVMNGKPVSIIGATPGRLGTARMQNHLRVSLANMNAKVMAQPAVMVMGASKIFSELGELTDAPTQDRVSLHLTEFDRWVRANSPVQE